MILPRAPITAPSNAITIMIGIKALIVVMMLSVLISVMSHTPFHFTSKMLYYKYTFKLFKHYHKNKHNFKLKNFYYINSMVKLYILELTYTIA